MEAVSVRDNVLLKPARLDAEEWKQMKSHSVRGDVIPLIDHHPLRAH